MNFTRRNYLKAAGTAGVLAAFGVQPVAAASAQMTSGVGVEYGGYEKGAFVAVGRRSGSDFIAAYGDHNDWTKSNDNRDPNLWGGEFVDYAVDPYTGDGVLLMKRDGKAQTINVRPFSGKPYFDVGPKTVLDDMVDPIAVAYGGYEKGQFVAIGKRQGGDYIAAYGDHNAWTKSKDNRDPNLWGGEFKGMAIDPTSGDGVLLMKRGGKAQTINIRSFSGKPWFDVGPKTVLDDMVDPLDVEYGGYGKGAFVAIGKRQGGDFIAAYGDHNAWTKSKDNRDPNLWGGSFVDMAIDPSSGDGVVLMDRDGKAQTINVRQFYGKPWFDVGTKTVV